MKALKIIGRILLTIFFIVLIFCIVVVCTYTLGAPDMTKGTDSRALITGPWKSVSVEGEDVYELTFDQTGKFTVKLNKTQIADGFFKIKESGSGKGKIKLFMLPGHYTSEYNKFVKYKVLSEISYSALSFSLTDSDEIDEENVPNAIFMLKGGESAADNHSVECELTAVTIDLYNSDKDLTKDAK